MPLFSYLSVCEWGFMLFCIVFCVRNAIFICFSLKSFVILLVSLPVYVKVVQFVFRCCESVFSCCSCGIGCFVAWFILYLLCSVLCMTFNSFSFASFLLDTYLIYSIGG
jgi:hypothetical protein